MGGLHDPADRRSLGGKMQQPTNGNSCAGLQGRKGRGTKQLGFWAVLKIESPLLGELQKLPCLGNKGYMFVKGNDLGDGKTAPD